jgi:ABC-2 type transport system ATP-binding protein
MDEAERCHRLAYIGYGKLLVQGSLSEVIAEAHLTTWAVSGPDLLNLRNQLRAHPEVTQAVPFGNTLHVSGDDAARLQQIVAPYQRAPYVWREIDSSLEDAFMLYMNRALAAKEKRDAA